MGRVLFLTSNFPRWPNDSTTPFVLRLAHDLQQIGWDVLVLAPHAVGAQAHERLDEVEVRRFRYLWPESAQTVCYEGGALINLRRNRGNYAKLPALVASEFAHVVTVLARREIDIVHSHWILPQGLVAGVAASVARVPHVATVHGGDVFALRGRLMRLLKQAAVGLADVVTVNSYATMNAVARTHTARAEVDQGSHRRDRATKSSIDRGRHIVPATGSVQGRCWYSPAD